VRSPLILEDRELIVLHQDLTVNAKLPDARRSMRTKGIAGYDISREAYMMWVNRRAVNSS
jgi:bromodomain adjacent to zinc finger domain protein 1A